MLSDFVKTYSDRHYRHPTMLRHKGTVVAFAMDDRRRIYYTVLDMNNPQNTSPFDVDHWLPNPQVLPFATELARVGFGITDQTALPVVKLGSQTPVKMGETVRADEIDPFLSSTARLGADAPFQVLSDGEFVYVFRQAIDAADPNQIFAVDQAGRPLLDGAGQPVPLVNATLLADRFVLVGTRLEPRQEVRYQRSRSKTRPQSRKDSLAAQDMNGQPFIEPTQELGFIGGLTGGRFSVALVPTQVAEVERWQIFAYRADGAMIDSISVERSSDGLFNTQGSQCYTCTDHPDVFALQPGMCVQPSLSDPAQLCGKTLIPIVDTTGYAGEALSFNTPDDYVELNPAVTLGNQFTIEAWINPTGDGAVLGSGGDPAKAAPSLWVVQNQVLVGFGDGAAWHVASTPPILENGAWHNLAVTFDGDQLRVYVDGLLRYSTRDFTGQTPAGAVTRLGTLPAPADGGTGSSPATGSTTANTAPNTSASGTSYQGQLDELRLWTLARPGFDIRAGLNQRLTGLEPGLASYWRFDEGTAAVATGSGTIYDEARGGATGALHGPTWVPSGAALGNGSGVQRDSLRLAGREVQSGLASQLYYQQERVTAGYGGLDKPLKQSARLMLALATTDSAAPANREIAVLDFGVARDGRPAQVPAVLPLAVIARPSVPGGDTDALIQTAAELGQAVVADSAGIVNANATIQQETQALAILSDVLDRDIIPTLPLTGPVASLNTDLSAYVTARQQYNAARVVRQWLDDWLATAQVTLWEDSGFRGRSLTYGQGFVGYTELNAHGFNDLISSLSIPDPLSVTAYSDANRGGNSRVFTGYVGNVGNAWNDVISSMDIGESATYADQRERAASTEQVRYAERQRTLAQLANDRTKAQFALAEAQRMLAQLRLKLAADQAALDKARLAIAGDAPVTMPLLHIDPNGLTIAGAVLGFAWTDDTPLLFDSATGRVALYFRGAPGGTSSRQFFVAYYDTLTGRAQYDLAADSGGVTLVARSAEQELDSLQVKVEAESNPKLGKVMITAGAAAGGQGTTITETWLHVPLDVQTFADVLNGRTTRTFAGRSAALAGQIDSLPVPAGLALPLAQGSLLQAGDAILTVLADTPRGAMAVPVAGVSLSLDDGTPLFVVVYDYSRATLTGIPGKLNKGSLLVRASAEGASGRVSTDQPPAANGQTPSCRWFGAVPGNTLAFDGQNTLAKPITGDATAGNAAAFTAPSDLTLETWVNPTGTGDVQRVIVQDDSTGAYTLGLRRHVYNSALVLNGSNDFVSIPNSTALDVSGPLTIEVWVRPDQVDDLQNIVSHAGPLNPKALDAGVEIEAPEVFLRVQKGRYEAGSSGRKIDNAYRWVASLPATGDAGEWVHLAAVYDGTAWTLYRNGDPGADPGNPAPDPNPHTGLHSWAIGVRPQTGTPGTAGSGPDRFLKGAVDEVRIWQGARTPRQILTNMNRRLTGEEDGLVAYWHFEPYSAPGAPPATGPVAHDYARNHLDGTLAGRPAPAASPLRSYVPFAAAGTRIAQAQDTAIFGAGNWTHLAAAYHQGYAVKLAGQGAYLDAGDSSTLNISSDLTVEAFVQLDDLTTPQAILAKGMLDDGTDQDVPYSLYVGTDGKLVFAFEDSDHAVQTLASTDALSPSRFYRIGVTRAQQVQVQTPAANQASGGQPVDPTKQNPVKKWADINFYINGQDAGYHKYEGKEAGGTDQPFWIGRAYMPGAVEATCRGTVAEVRVWRVARQATDVGADIKGSETGLVSWWRFTENMGSSVMDSKSSNHATINGNGTWVKTPDPLGSNLQLYVNGDNVPLLAPGAPQPPVSPATPQFTLGGLANQPPAELFQGQMEELRIWRTERTQQEIQDNLFRRVTADIEDLIAYYTFDAEDKDKLCDHSFRGNDLSVPNALFVYSTAPIGEDTPQVRSALMGIRTDFNATIDSTPACQEYGELQTDAGGNLTGALKRCYASIQGTAWQLITGFKIGDLTAEWVSQVQTDPQLIGYIEGAPPVPSENLTYNMYGYNGAASVTLTEADTTTYTYASSRDKGFDTQVEGAASIPLTPGGQEFAGEVLAPLGVGTVMMQEVLATDVKVGVRASFENSLGWLDEASTGQGRTLTRASSLEMDGVWETPEAPAFPKIGRRYVPANSGLALVQSETADVFALRLQSTGALVAYQLRPNPDIPRDWNIITFPVNPRYTKQGSLDGKVGFDPDPDYPNALTYSPDSSYFKPIEAYNLKHSIEQEEQQWAALFDQYDAGGLGRRQSITQFSDKDLAVGRMLSKLPNFTKHNMANTYVWTADGGLFTETEQTLDVWHEMTGGSFQFKGLAGAFINADVKVLGARLLGLELSALFGGHLNLQVTKAQDAQRSFAVTNTLTTERNIFQLDAQGNTKFDRADPLRPKPLRQPGKVDAYRFITFYLEPLTRNFDVFYNQVVDPIWLAQSDDPAAAALRGARQADTRPPCWRVLHRVTYVSRVLEPITQQPQSLEQALPALDITSNFELIKTLEPFVRDHTASYTEFSGAVRRAVSTYLPDLAGYIEQILQYMVLYYGVDDAPQLAGANAGGMSDDGSQPLGVEPFPPQQANLDGGAVLQATITGTQAPTSLTLAWSELSGPAPVYFSAPHSAATTAGFSEKGLYVLRFMATDGQQAVKQDLRLTVNAVPVIEAGPDQELAPHASAQLAAHILDDGLGDPREAGKVKVAWTQVSGPGTATFSDAASLSPSVTLDASGTYILRLTVDNGHSKATADLKLVVEARVMRNLIALYTFKDGGGTRVRDISGASFDSPLDLTVAGNGAVQWQRGSLALQAPGLLASAGDARRIAAAMRTSNELTIEAWLVPAPGFAAAGQTNGHNGLHRIVTLAGGPGASDFILGQAGNSYHAGLRTSQTDPNGSTRALAAGLATPGVPAHVAFTRAADGTVCLYVNGELAGQRTIPGSLSAWDDGFTLALGDDPSGSPQRAWPGAFRLMALYDRALSAIEIRQNCNFGPDANLMPLVVAGSDETINLPAAAQATGQKATLQLQGHAVDDALPADQLKIAWTQVSGPGTVAFTAANALATAATFPTHGRYVLRLTVTDDGGLNSSSDVAVSVNYAPAVGTGAGQSLDAAALPASLALEGGASDDGLAVRGQHPLAYHWSKVSGPGEVQFADPTNPQTTATFGAAGAYTLRLTANNGYLDGQADAAVTINTVPIVQARASGVVNRPATANLNSQLSSSGLGDQAGAVKLAWSMVSGPAEVTFSDPSSAQTGATFSASGVYVLRLTANNGHFTASADVSITANDAPSVDAGPNQTIQLPGTATLEGVVADDGLPDPPGALTLTWSKAGGPGDARFADPRADFTTAAFTQKGVYMLRLTAADGAAEASSDVQIIVNAAPTVNAGGDQTALPGVTVTLRGTVTDDGLADPAQGKLTTRWTQAAGPGSTAFADAAAPQTTATFSQPGVYTLRLEADNGLATGHDDVRIALHRPPVAQAGPAQEITLPAQAHLRGSANGDPGTALTLRWSKLSGPGTVTFANDGQADANATFSSFGIYRLRLTADDGLSSASSDVQVTAHMAPIQPAVPPGRGLIELHVSSAPANAWSVVEWKDGAGKWHQVDGWKGALQDGMVHWTVDPPQLGGGPYHWQVYASQGGPLLGTSNEFNLPQHPGESVVIELLLQG